MCLEASLKQYLNSFKNEKAPEAFQRTFLTKQKKKTNYSNEEIRSAGRFKSQNRDHKEFRIQREL